LRLGDILDGKNGLLLAGSNPEAWELSRRVQEKLVAMGLVSEPVVHLSDENMAGIGDLIRARLNTEIDAGGQRLTNRDTLRITGLAGVTLTRPVQTNAVFAQLPPASRFVALPQSRLTGYVPAGWYPTAVAVTRDGPVTTLLSRARHHDAQTVLHLPAGLVIGLRRRRPARRRPGDQARPARLAIRGDPTPYRAGIDVEELGDLLGRVPLQDALDGEKATCQWKPIAESPKERRIELAEHYPKLKAKLKEVRQQLVPQAAAAIASLKQALGD